MTEQRVIDTVDEFFDIISRWCMSSRIGGDLREHFLSLPDFHEDFDFDVGDVVIGLAHAANTSNLGLWLDHREYFLIQERCTAMIEFRVGRPDEFWSKPELYTDFVWDGSDFVDGLQAFDRWLAEENLDLRGVPLRLLNIFTGSDFYLSYLCPEDRVADAMRCLESLGVQSSLFDL